MKNTLLKKRKKRILKQVKYGGPIKPLKRKPKPVKVKTAKKKPTPLKVKGIGVPLKDKVFKPPVKKKKKRFL